jgi:hypothetical protein
MYWHQGTGNINDATKWFSQSNGQGDAGRVPLPQDVLVFDGSSFDGASTITQNMARIGTINFLDATNNPSFTTSTAAEVYGSIILGTLQLTASSQAYTLMGRGSYSITSNSNIWAKAFTLNAPNGTYTLNDDMPISVSGTAWTGTAGTIAGTGYINLTYNGATGVTFAGGGLGTYNLWIATTGTSVCTITGSNSFTNFKCTAGRSIIFTNSTTQTIANSPLISGTEGGKTTLRNSSSTTKFNLTKSGTAVLGVDYLDVQYCAALPAIWYVGENSITNNANNTGLKFTAFTEFPANSGNFFMFFK